jgi:hypothetical protein
MSVTTEVHKAWISTECSCDDEFECWGDCHEDDLGIVGMVLDRWLIANGMDNDEPNVLIRTDRMNWNGVSGQCVVEFNDILNALKLNGDWKVEFRLDGKDLTACRYSHDEPCGALFTLTTTDEEVER